MKSARQDIWSQISGPNVERSKEVRPSKLKTTMSPDYIYPIYWDKVIPGDTHSVKMHNFVRMTNPLKSVPMDNLFLETFWFYIPTRILWANFVRFMGEQDNPGDSTDFTYPKMNNYVGFGDGEGNTHQWPEGSIWDYFGLPIKKTFPHASAADNFISAMLPRAYNRCIHYWFRDQNLQDAPFLTTGDGPDHYTDSASSIDNYRLRKRCKQRDYFTSALSTPQKGPDVEIPIGSSAPVFGNQYGVELWDGTYHGKLGVTAASGVSFLDVGGPADSLVGATHTGSLGNPRVLGVRTKAELGSHPEYSGLYASLEDATATNVNEFRLLFAKQKYYERKMRGGSRYKELIQSMFGVSVPDFRVQWPELLGVTSQNMQSQEIMQTSGTGASGTSTALGQLSAQMKSGRSRAIFNKSIVEHGYILGLANIRAELNYYQGIEHHWTESTVFDEFWPQFGHIGEQPIFNREIYYEDEAAGPSTYNTGVWGYQAAWSWLKYRNNHLTGQMRPDATINFKQWHMAQELNKPALDSDFIESNVPISRVSSSTAADYFMVDYLYETISIRPIPFNTDPGLLDHF